MTKFAVVATYEIEPEQIEAFMPLLLAHRARCLEDEPGTLRFDILRPERNLMLYEVYEDEAAFQDHRNGASVSRLRTDAAAIKRNLTFVTSSLIE